MAESKSKQSTVSRRLPAGDKKRGLEQHVKLVGEVVWAWNELHLAYAFAFAWAVNEKRSWVGQAIWNTISNDTVQRDALKSILWFLGNRRLRTAFEWALKETGKLAQYRNDVVHGAMMWLARPKYPVPTLDVFGNPISRLIRYADREIPSGEFVEGPDLQKLMDLLRGDLMQLAEYVGELSRAIGKEKSPPLPRRPRLRAREFARRPGFESPPKRPRARGTPPKPSRSSPRKK